MCSFSCDNSRVTVLLHKNKKSMQSIHNFSELTSLLKSQTVQKSVAMVCPNDSHTEYVIDRALREGIARFCLVLGGQRADFVDRFLREWPDYVSVEDAGTPDDAARRAVELVRNGEADVLMKGTINTDNLLRAVLNKEHGLLERGHVMTHVAVAELPAYPRLLVFSDAAVVPRPTQVQFEAILGYVVDVCRRLGRECPAIALMHCTEKVSEKFPHTLYYEELKRQAQEGRWGTVNVGGPMDVKSACDAESAAIKGIQSPVVGKADALIFPNIESGNVFYKTITLFGSAQTAGMLYGTTKPVVVASRADSGESKFYSLALACLTD